MKQSRAEQRKATRHSPARRIPPASAHPSRNAPAGPRCAALRHQEGRQHPLECSPSPAEARPPACCLPCGCLPEDSRSILAGRRTLECADCGPLGGSQVEAEGQVPTLHRSRQRRRRLHQRCPGRRLQRHALPARLRQAAMGRRQGKPGAQLSGSEQAERRWERGRRLRQPVRRESQEPGAPPVACTCSLPSFS